MRAEHPAELPFPTVVTIAGAAPQSGACRWKLSRPGCAPNADASRGSSARSGPRLLAQVVSVGAEEIVRVWCDRLTRLDAIGGVAGAVRDDDDVGQADRPTAVVAGERVV